MFRKPIILATFALLLIAADEKLTAYSNQQHGFKLSYPAQLSVMDAPNERVILYLGTQDDGPDDIFRESVQVKIEADGLDAKSLDDIVPAFENSMKRSEINIVESKRVELGGRPAQRIMYTHALNLPGGAVQAKATTYLMLKGQTAYGLDARATDKTFDRFMPIAQKVFDSFQWTDVQKKP